MSRYISDRIARYLIYVSGTFSFLILLAIGIFILQEGLPAFDKVGLLQFLFGIEWRPTSGMFGILPMIIGSVVVTICAMIIAIPLGLTCAILLAEVAPNRVRTFLRPAVELLVGIPSVVYGIVGMFLIVPFIRSIGGTGFSVAAAAIVLAAMVLPTIITITEDSIRAVPVGYKEGSLALGSTHWQTVWHVMIPAAKSGIVAGIILGMGRAIGETMAMIMVIGNSIIIPTSLLSPARTLTGNIAVEITYASGTHESALFATGVVLFLLIIILNSTALLIIKREQGLAMSAKSSQRLALAFIWAGGAITLIILACIVIYVIVRGAGALNIDFLITPPRGGLSGEGGISSTIVSTFYLIALTLVILIPFGLGAAIYLVEYARDNWFTGVIRYGVDTLAAVPSIVFGLFGFAVFVTALHFRFSILSGALTLACLLLPTLIKTSEEALKAVPQGHREASLALGTTKWQTVRHVLLPSALPGIVTGIILCIGRGIGETACLYVTMGGSAAMPSSLLSGGRTLALHVFYLATETNAFEKAMATGMVLILLIIGVNLATNFLSRRFQRLLCGKLVE